MTDNLNYQDVFKTNIPELDQDFRLHARHLLAAAQNSDPDDTDINIYRHSYIDTPEITQAIWELRPKPEETDETKELEDADETKELEDADTTETAKTKKRLERPQRLLAITVMDSYFCVAIDRQPTVEHPYTVRVSTRSGWILDGEANKETFEDLFYDTVAALGLKDHLLRAFGTQKVSSVESFANAA